MINTYICKIDTHFSIETISIVHIPNIYLLRQIIFITQNVKHSLLYESVPPHKI
jgi:hypothetical protein